MKNKIIFLMVFVLAIAGLSSCDDETTAGFTEITYYPTLELLGEPSVIAPLGQNYVDAGVKAELLGEDVTDQVVINSSVDTNVGGVYSVSYEIINVDGYSRKTSRTVYVADPTPSVIATGMHTVSSGTHRLRLGVRTDYSGYDILILQTAPGEFYISDFLGGYYDQRAAYGSNYACTGTFKLNADNTLSLINSSVAGWGDSLSGLADASIDPATGAISWTAKYAGMDFNVKMN